MPVDAAFSRTALPPGLADSDLFHRWGADSLKLYVWLRARARARGPVASEPDGGRRRGYLEVDAPGSEIEAAIGVSKNTVTKLVRELQELGVATSRGDRSGYHFRLGEWFTRRAGDGGLELWGEAFYLDALLSAGSRSDSVP